MSIGSSHLPIGPSYYSCFCSRCACLLPCAPSHINWGCALVSCHLSCTAILSIRVSPCLSYDCVLPSCLDALCLAICCYRTVSGIFTWPGWSQVVTPPFNSSQGQQAEKPADCSQRGATPATGNIKKGPAGSSPACPAAKTRCQASRSCPSRCWSPPPAGPPPVARSRRRTAPPLPPPPPP